MRQVLSYALTGVLINTLGYAVYLLIADLSGAPKLTMTVLYFVGALFGFFANRKFTFLHDGHIGAAGIRYVIAQFMGYLLNLTLLVLFVDWLGFMHQVVQAVAIVVVAIFLFILLRFFVFAQQSLENRAIRS
ncbi:GtrA family protein [Pseudomonas leptonychotis]|uniref:GtrA family protein n=1 Tax=Pseudomonas leptonychotis TaxID=2448482 RepID=UPI00386F6C7A